MDGTGEVQAPEPAYGRLARAMPSIKSKPYKVPVESLKSGTCSFLRVADNMICRRFSGGRGGGGEEENSL